MIDVVGIGDGGWDSLGTREQELVRGARALVGGRRHLELVPRVAGQARHPWPSPMRSGLAALLTEVGAEHPDSGVVVLASGDPLLSGVGSALIDRLGPDEVRITPSTSSETLARARMGWSAEDSTWVSVVGRATGRLRRHLAPGARVVVLCSDGSTPAELARLLVDEGCGDSAMTALWHLGGPDEGRRDGTAATWGAAPTPDLVTVCVTVDAVARPAAGPAPGRDEAAYEHDGQISKRDVRASALAHLRPAPGAMLWDLGAGSGAIGIEWCLAAPRARAVAVERDVARAARIARNADRLGVPSEVHVVEADVLEMVRWPDVPPADAVFIGGGVSLELIGAIWIRLEPGARLVAHAVTLESETVLVAAHDHFGGHLSRISVEHAVPLGTHVSWTPARAVVQWSVTRPADPVEEQG